MRKLLAAVLCLLLPVNAAFAATLKASKAPAPDAAAGCYAYVLTVENSSDTVLRRIFVEEYGAEGLIGGFVRYEGADTLLNQNGTATILSLAPGESVRLYYEAQLPEPMQQTTLQTVCGLSVMRTDAAGTQRLVVMAVADDPIALSTSTPTPTATLSPAPTAIPSGGRMQLTLAQTAYVSGTTGCLENTLILTNIGELPMTDARLMLEELRLSNEETVEGTWLDTQNWTLDASGDLCQPDGTVLMPGESLVFRCCWTIPQQVEASVTGSGAVRGWMTMEDNIRQDACAVFQLQGMPWTLHVAAGVALDQTDCLWLAGTLILCLLMIACFRLRRIARQAR